MHMPYPNYVPNGKKELNEYLRNVVAPKSMKICAFFECPYIVVHGFKLARHYGSEAAEWEQTERFLDFLAPMAKEMGITVCMENIYNVTGGPTADDVESVSLADRTQHAPPGMTSTVATKAVAK